MRRRRVKIRVKIIVLETGPLQIDMRRRRVKIRVKIIVLETVPLQIKVTTAAGSKLGEKLSSSRPFRFKCK
jgi:hypothetical protein